MIKSLLQSPYRHDELNDEEVISMARELVSRSIWDFPALRLSSLLDDDNDLLSSFFQGDSTSTGLSVSEDDQNVYVEATVPGMTPQDIDVTFDQGMLRIRGEAQQKDDDAQRRYYRRASRAFNYRVAIPGDVDPNAEPQASYENGILRLTFPKSKAAQQDQPKKITVNMGGQQAKEGKDQGRGK